MYKIEILQVSYSKKRILYMSCHFMYKQIKEHAY